jgi:hypothetical protein
MEAYNYCEKNEKCAGCIVWGLSWLEHKTRAKRQIETLWL